jgi:hypothetical protein
MHSIEPRLQAALDEAVNRIRQTVATVAVRASESMGAAAAATTKVTERDTILAAQQELRRNGGNFQDAFHRALREKIEQELAPRSEPKRKLANADWQSLSLVDDGELEARLNFERIGQLISQECEWQLRELAAYMGSITGLGRADEDRNPLRADIIGAALYRGIEAVTDDADSRKALAKELGLAMSQAMADCYAEILKGLQQRGVQPVNLTVRTVEGPGVHLGAANSGYASLSSFDRSSMRGAHGELGDSGGSGFDLMHEHRRALAAAEAAAAPTTGAAARPPIPAPRVTVRSSGRHALEPQGYDPRLADPRYAELRQAELRARDSRYADPRHADPSYATAHAPSLYGPADLSPVEARAARARASQADQQLMTLLRRLTAVASRSGEFSGAPLERSFGAVPAGAAPSGLGGIASGVRAAEFARSGDGSMSGVSMAGGSVGGATASPAGPTGYAADGLTGLMAVNLIRAHREELLQASTGKLDHMVIDVVGSLFDQILSDSRVPPQMARQIARLQLPVLRVALVDQTFFSTRRHPVRRFINRIASLACAFEEFEDGPGRQFLSRVSQLVQEIVDGDFDQVELYTQKLQELERFIQEQTEGAVVQSGAASTLASKESELRIQQRYMLQLQGALEPLALPAYLSEFLSQVWSQALVIALRQDPESDRAKRFRRVGRDVVMSVQPKGSPAMRKRFLMQLPPLMKDLNEGMQLIGWPEAAQREFFGKLLPAHAESLKGAPMTELAHNLMVKQLEGIFAMPIPGTEPISPLEPVPDVPEEVIERRFTPEEAQKVGLVQESTIDWSGGVDIEIGGEDASPETASGMTTAAGSLTDSQRAVLTDSQRAGLTDSQRDALASTPSQAGEPAEASRGAALMDHIKVGFAYQMLLKDDWQKVRLAHVSTGRAFFVFTRAPKHQETLSMTSRMLARMCETGRMRAVESAYLMERATRRARKQLAEMKTASPTRH